MFENINIQIAGLDMTGQYTSGDRQVISITDLLSEGPIQGLVDSQSSIYLNDDRVAPLSQSGNAYSATAATVRLTNNSTQAVIVSAGSTPVIEATNGDKYLIVRGVHKIYVNATNGSRSDSNGNVTAKLTTVNNAGFFTNNMISSGSEDLETLVPARLTIVGRGTSGSLVEGSIISRASQSVASFQPGAGSPQGLIVPEGTYFLHIDRVVKIASISGPVLTLASAWPFPTTGSYQEYSFDVSGAIVSNADVMSQTEIKKYKSVTSQFRVGTLDQPPFTGYGGVGSTSITNSPSAGGTLEQSTGYGGSQAPKELVGSSASGFNLTAAQLQEVDETTLTIAYPNGLYAVSGKGTDKTTYAQYKIELALQRPGESSFGSYTVLHNPFQHAALEKNAISFVTRIDLDQYRPFSDFKVRVSRISNHTGPGYKSPGETYHDWQNISASSLSTVTSVLKTILTHPFTSMAKTTFDTKQFQSMPTRSFHLKGLKVLVPSNYVTRDQDASGIANYNRNTSTGAIETSYQDWDGSFGADKVYTNNPAWIFYDILTNNRYGLGDFLSHSDVDKYSLYRIARYCDELVPDGKGGQEPRFTSNLYLTKAADAYKVLKDISTVFRSMIYFFDGKITPIPDAPSGPVYNFTSANVLEGAFSYESTGSKTRINQVIVTWINPESNYKAEPLIVEDRLNIAETGKIISQTAVAMGATSEGQAMRYGRWKLWTAANQREVVTFSTALNGAFLAPGDIINVQDPNRFAVRLGGRVSNTGSRTSSVIPLDTSTVLNSGSTYELSVLFTEPAAFATSEITIDNKTYKAGDLITHAFIDGDGDGGSTGNGTYTLQAIDTEQKAQNAKATATSSDSLILTWTDTTRVETKEVDTGAGTVSSLTVKTSGNDVNGNPNTAFSSTPDADTIWVLTEKINSVTVASSSKQYKVLAMSEGSKNEISISAVEHYDEKFDAVDTDFTTYIADTIYPTVTSDDIVPPPLDVFSTTMPKKGQVGEELLVSWVAPTNVGDFPGDYEHLFGFEITHDFPGLENPIRISDPKQRTWKIDGIEDGTYSVAVRTINVLNNLSEPVKIKVTITDRFDESIPRLALGIPMGGTCSATTSLDSSGLFSLSKNVYGFRPPQSTGAFLSSSSTNTNTYQLDISNLPTITWTGQAESGEFIEEHHYIVMQANASANIMKLIKYKKDSSHNIPYWFDAGNGSETVGLASLTGSILASSATKIGGIGTSFTTELAVGSLLVVGSEAALVSSIESDTILYIDRPISITSTSSASTNNYHFDYTNHTVIARVYKETNAGNNMVSFISLDTTLAQTMERFLYALVANEGSAPTYTSSAGTFEDPANGVGAAWSLNLPSLANNKDVIYVIKRILTEDGQPPQEDNWSAASVYAKRIDGDPVKVANLSASQYVIPYSEANSENTTLTFTAKAINFATGSRQYKFFVDNVEKQDTSETADSKTFVLSQADEPAANAQKTVKVQIIQGSTTAEDSTSIYGVRDGVDAFTTVLSNEAHSIPADENGLALSYANSGTDIRVFHGSTPLTYDASSSPAVNTFSVVASASSITVATGSTNVTTEDFNGVTNSTRRFGVASGMANADTSASITFTITARDAAGVATTLTRVQTFTKGNAGASAKVVNLTADKYVIPYDVDEDENTTITFTATAKNISGTKIYKFYVDNIIIGTSTPGTQSSTSNSVTCVLPDGSEPANGEQKTIRIDVEQPSGTLIASDSTSIYGVKDGEDAFTAVLTNESHTIPATFEGAAKTYANSGTDIRVFRGSTPLTYATSGANTFSVAAAASGLVSGDDKIGGASNHEFAVANDTRRYANLQAGAMANGTTSASITFTITARNQEGTDTTLTKVQSFTKGNDGTGILSVSKSGETVTVTYQDSSTDTFTVNGVSSVAKSGDTLTITYDDGTTSTIDDGGAGNGISSVSKSGETVTVTYDDGTTQTFTVADGISAVSGDPEYVTVSNIKKTAAGTYSADSLDIDFIFSQGGTVVAKRRYRVARDGNTWNTTVTTRDEDISDETNTDRLTAALTISSNNAILKVAYSDGSIASSASAPVSVILDGLGISSVAKVDETVTVTYDDASTDTFTVNGVSSVAKSGDTLTITYDDGTTSTIDDGDTGNGIASVSKSGETVTVTFDDATTTTFTVSDGNPSVSGDPDFVTVSTITKSSTGTYSADSLDIDFTFREGGATVLAKRRYRLARSSNGWASSVTERDADTSDESNVDRLTPAVTGSGQNAVVKVTYSYGGVTSTASAPVSVILDGQSAKLVQLFKKDDSSFSFTSGNTAANQTYASPTTGVESGWTTTQETPANGEVIYMVSRTFTSDGLAPQTSAWEGPVIVAQRTDGTTPTAIPGPSGFLYYITTTASVAASNITATSPATGQIAIVENSSGLQQGYRYNGSAWAAKDLINTGIIVADAIKSEQLQISSLDADATGTQDGIFLDGTTNSIKIFAGGALRVKIGNLS